MHFIFTRARRLPLAFLLTMVVACSDDPIAPVISMGAEPNANLVEEPFVVSNINDHGIGSLRWVLGYSTGGETIRFDAALAGQTIVLDSSLKIRHPVTIEGLATKGITISGGGKWRVIDVLVPGKTVLRNLSITGGNVETQAASGIYISNDTELQLEHTAVYGNSDAVGNVIFGGSVTLINSTVSSNIATSPGSEPFGAVQAKKIVMENSTVASNGGAGIAPMVGSATLKSSIIADNANHNCVAKGGATIIYEGVNISDDDSCGNPTQIMIGDPKLGALSDNGGPTMTQALLAGSPAINASVGCSLTTDQRYAPRDAKCDLGAFELTTPTTVTLTIDAGASVNQSTGSAVVTGTVKCTRNETFKVAVQLTQQQKSGKHGSTVDATAMVPVECTTVARPWTVSVVLTSGELENGWADAVATTVDAASWVTSWVTSASVEAQVKLYKGRGTK